ncbi:MAG TPA: hypothetical protein VEC38_10120 [Candidatus Binataceae bacterium]|nr:hypothetical protein [Candidatus Binataceae bacterium]
MNQRTTQGRTSASCDGTSIRAFPKRGRLHRLAVPAIAAAALIAFAQGAYAEDSENAGKVVACSATISSCGCTITKGGFYQVGAALSSSQGLTALNGCIDVKASNVTLNTGKETSRGRTDGGYSITGPGGGTPTGIGIHILKGSNNDFIELPSDVDSWDVGILVQGASNIVEDFDANNNGTAGVEVVGGKGNNINDFGTGGNGSYGVWISGGGSNQVNCSDTDGNGKVGVLVGCPGSTSAACSSKSNKIFDHTADGNGNYGIAIELGSTGNNVTDTSATGNGTDDLYDANSGCDSDLWYFNYFNTASASCID